MSTGKPDVTPEMLNWAQGVAISVVNPSLYPIDEARSDALMGLAKAYDRYDPSRQVPFKPFAYHYIVGEVLMGIRKHRNRTRCDAIAYSLQGRYTDGGLDEVERRLDIESLLDWARNNLEPRDYDYLAAAANGSLPRRGAPAQSRSEKFKRIIALTNGTFHPKHEHRR